MEIFCASSSASLTASRALRVVALETSVPAGAAFAEVPATRVEGLREIRSVEGDRRGPAGSMFLFERPGFGARGGRYFLLVGGGASKSESESGCSPLFCFWIVRSLEMLQKMWIKLTGPFGFLLLFAI